MLQHALEPIEQFFERLSNSSQPLTDYDPQWLSPCIESSDAPTPQHWRAHKRPQAGDFSGVESALELTLRAEIKRYYGSYFAGEVVGQWAERRVELVTVWNEQDFEYLLENLIGHLLMQQRLKQAPSVFIASTDDEMQVISVLNNTGEVVLEQLGRGVLEVLAPSLDEFLQALQLTS